MPSVKEAEEELLRAKKWESAFNRMRQAAEELERMSTYRIRIEFLEPEVLDEQGRITRR